MHAGRPKRKSVKFHPTDVVSGSIALLTSRICSAAALVLLAARAKIEASNAPIPRIQMQTR